MLIANPIYDSVFKYLLEDNEIAKILISNILNLKINELHLEPTEVISRIDGIKDFTIFRIDFKATITLEKGEKQVILIEIQKAKLQSDILRFRKYLGSQYKDDNNTLLVNKTKNAIPLYTIYFLGHTLKHAKDAPIINVTREYVNNYNKEKLTKKEEFIECLTHDSVIIQIPLFKKFKRNRLEKLLSIFESSTNHTVDVDDIDDPDYKKITRRLLAANSDSQVKFQMDLEDEILQELANNVRALEKAEEKAEKEQQLKEEAILKLKSSIILLFSAGISKEIIAQNLKISISEVEQILRN